MWGTNRLDLSQELLNDLALPYQSLAANTVLSGDEELLCKYYLVYCT